MCLSDLVWAVTSKVIVAFSYNLVKMFIMISRCDMYKTNYDSLSKGQGQTLRSKVKNV